jgi:hypothetical protein
VDEVSIYISGNLDVDEVVGRGNTQKRNPHNFKYFAVLFQVQPPPTAYSP